MAQKLGQIPTEFPSQAVSDAVKNSQEYGLSVARAIEQEWFNRDNSVGRFWQTRDEYNKLRLYARGEQSIRKYKDEFAINGDLSYLNLDWKPVPIIPKFVDIIVNGMQDRLFTIKAFAQDPIATGKRTKFVENIQRDLHAKEILAEIEAELGVNARNVPEEKLPANICRTQNKLQNKPIFLALIIVLQKNELQIFAERKKNCKINRYL